MKGEYLIGVWNYLEQRDRVREYVIAVFATKEQAGEYVKTYMLKEIEDECLPACERSRLFLREVYVHGVTLV